MNYCIQCRHESGKIGDFYTTPDGSHGPLFNDLCDLFAWMRQNNIVAIHK